MSRTTRDLPYKCDEVVRDGNYVRIEPKEVAVRRFTTRTLRYSSQEMRQAARENRKAVPVRVVRKLVWFHYSWGSPSVTRRREFLSSDRENAARTSVRDQLVNARNGYNTHGEDFDVDIKPLARWDIGWDLW